MMTTLDNWVSALFADPRSTVFGEAGVTPGNDFASDARKTNRESGDVFQPDWTGSHNV